MPKPFDILKIIILKTRRMLNESRRLVFSLWMWYFCQRVNVYTIYYFILWVISAMGARKNKGMQRSDQRCMSALLLPSLTQMVGAGRGGGATNVSLVAAAVFSGGCPEQTFAWSMLWFTFMPLLWWWCPPAKTGVAIAAIPVTAIAATIAVNANIVGLWFMPHLFLL